MSCTDLPSVPPQYAHFELTQGSDERLKDVLDRCTDPDINLLDWLHAVAGTERGTTRSDGLSGPQDDLSKVIQRNLSSIRRGIVDDGELKERMEITPIRTEPPKTRMKSPKVMSKVPPLMQTRQERAQNRVEWYPRQQEDKHKPNVKSQARARDSLVVLTS